MVVDDQRLVRKCIRAKLESIRDFQVVAEAESGEQASICAREIEMDIVLMDLNMPGIGGLDAARRLLAALPDIKIVGLSMYVDGPYPRKFMEMGGAGYVSKNADTDELVQAIQEVHKGKGYISADVAQIIAATAASERDGRGVDSLSHREIQVLQRISEGFTIDEIADGLRLSPKTIAYHRRSLFRKLDVGNDVQLTILAHRHGLTDIGELYVD